MGVFQTAIGASGTTISSGFLREDYNQALIGQAGSREYEKMRKGDGQVRAALKACQYPIESANWFIDIPEDLSAKDKEAHEFINNVLFNVIDFKTFLRQGLSMLDFGFSVFEKIYALDEVGRVIIRQLQQRVQPSIYSWEIPPDKGGRMPSIENNGNFQGVTQDLWQQGLTQAYIPMEKLVVFAFEKEGDNYEGVSMLRSAYKHWKIKDILYNIDAMAAERHGLGVLDIGLSVNSDEMFAIAEEMASNYYANKTQYIIHQKDQMEVKFVEGNNENRDITKSIDHHNKEIVKSVLAQFLEIGTSSSGSYSASNDQTSLFYLSLESIAKQLQNTIQKTVIDEMIRLNYPDIEVSPQLKFSNIGNPNQNNIAEIMSKLISAGALTTDEDLENWTRQTFELPSIDPEVRAAEIERKSKEQEAKDKMKDDTEDDSDDDEEKEKKDEERKKASDEYIENAYKLRMKAHEVFIKPMTFADSFKPYRKLTMAEEKVDFNSFEKFYKEKQLEFNTKVNPILQESLDKLTVEIEKAAAAGNVKKLNSLKLDGIEEYTKALASIYRDSYNFGKLTSADEMKVAAKKTTSEVITMQKAKIDSIVDRQVAEMMMDIQITISDGIIAGTGAKEIAFAATKAASNTLNRLNQRQSQLAMVVTITQGRDFMVDQNLVKIEMIQYSAVLDARTTNWCRSLDGLTIKADDVDRGTYDPGQHFGCRSIWVSIMKEEKTEQPLTNIDKRKIPPQNSPTSFQDLPTVRDGALNKEKTASEPEPKKVVKAPAAIVASEDCDVDMEELIGIIND